MERIRAAITGIHAWLPEYRLTNDELATMVDTSDEWIMQRIGIKEHVIALIFCFNPLPLPYEAKSENKDLTNIIKKCRFYIFSRIDRDPLSIPSTQYSNIPLFQPSMRLMQADGRKKHYNSNNLWRFRYIHLTIQQTICQDRRQVSNLNSNVLFQRRILLGTFEMDLAFET